MTAPTASRKQWRMRPQKGAGRWGTDEGSARKVNSRDRHGTTLRAAGHFTLREEYESVPVFRLSNCRRVSLASWSFVLATAMSGAVLVIAPPVHAVPSPDVDYLYNVTVRRAYTFPNGDPIGYGHGICDKVTGGRELRPGDGKCEKRRHAQR